MRRGAGEGDRDNAGAPISTAQVFRWLFSCVLLWISVPPILALAAAMIEGWWTSIGAALAIAAALAAIAFVLRKVEPVASGVLLLVAVAAVVLMAWHLQTGATLSFLLGGELPVSVQAGLVIAGPASSLPRSSRAWSSEASPGRR